MHVSRPRAVLYWLDGFDWSVLAIGAKLLQVGA